MIAPSGVGLDDCLKFEVWEDARRPNRSLRTWKSGQHEKEQEQIVSKLSVVGGDMTSSE